LPRKIPAAVVFEAPFYARVTKTKSKKHRTSVTASNPISSHRQRQGGAKHYEPIQKCQLSTRKHYPAFPSHISPTSRLLFTAFRQTNNASTALDPRRTHLFAVSSSPFAPDVATG